MTIPQCADQLTLNSLSTTHQIAGYLRTGNQSAGLVLSSHGALEIRHPDAEQTTLFSANAPGQAAGRCYDPTTNQPRSLLFTAAGGSQ